MNTLNCIAIVCVATRKILKGKLALKDR